MTTTALRKCTADSIIEPLDCRPQAESVAVSFARDTAPAILETQTSVGSYGPFSIYACDPVDVVEIAGSTTAAPATTMPLTALAQCIARYPKIEHSAPDGPFCGGWIGYIGYEAGLSIEGLAPATIHDVDIPLLRFGLYDSAAVLDRRTGRWYATAVDWPEPFCRRRPSAARRIRAIRERLNQAATVPPKESRRSVHAAAPRASMTRQAYESAVARAKQHIEAGDIYQVNLTQRFSTTTDMTPIELFLRLRRVSPAPYAALLSWRDRAVISSSPELFLRLGGGHVVTRPIKGTRPRHVDPSTDRALREELVRSEKDRAELNMIVDLLRNDLGRVCEYGSVRVIDPGEIEQHPTVYHRVATIEGRLRTDAGWLDLLTATLPGGSITGAPKIRAMQIINELEPTARTAYCGAIGLIGLDGSLSLNVAIRTMVQVGSSVHVYAGGAIVADSTADEEYEEIMAKADGMFAALGCPRPTARQITTGVANK
ncbi:MAG: aminodeoxychorismate synthase component I [Planctomycetes bacterium]|nr:aminodeoxychorismate synthase component I [Planctomycetota bacterium]